MYWTWTSLPLLHANKILVCFVCYCLVLLFILSCKVASHLLDCVEAAGEGYVQAEDMFTELQCNTLLYAHKFKLYFTLLQLAKYSKWQVLVDP